MNPLLIRLCVGALVAVVSTAVTVFVNLKKSEPVRCRHQEPESNLGNVRPPLPERQRKNPQCKICMTDVDGSWLFDILDCGHKFHRDCLKLVLEEEVGLMPKGIISLSDPIENLKKMKGFYLQASFGKKQEKLSRRELPCPY